MEEAQHIAKVTGERERDRERNGECGAWSVYTVHSGTTRGVCFGSQNANIYINLTPGRTGVVQRGVNRQPAALT